MTKFSKRMVFSHTVDELFSWHERKGIIKRLIPPWENVKVIKEPESLHNSEAILLLKLAPLVQFKWHAIHVDYIKNKQFKDIQLSGPFRKWEHKHIFNEIDEQHSELIDDIYFEPMFRPLSNIFAEKLILQKLSSTFSYRHTITKNDLDFLNRIKSKKKFNIAIAGSGGMIGRSLIPLLESHGHTVYPIKRKKDDNSIYFDEKNSELMGNFENIDVVINLAGEPIGEGRWTEEKKRLFEKSRIDFTKSLVSACSKLQHIPEHFINASAVGFYGNSIQQLTEKSPKGSLYISDLCDRWEKATENNFMKTTILRIGVVLSPASGALKKLITLCNLNLGAKLGTGEQLISWITIDDLTYSVLYIIYNSMDGVFNMTTPNPVSQRELVDKISANLKRTRFISLNEDIVRTVYGKMGDEILLSSSNIYPERLIKSGFNFYFDDIDKALNHLMGISNE